MTSAVFNWKRVALILAVALLPMLSAMTAQADYASVIQAEPSLYSYYRFDSDTGVSGSAAIDEKGSNHGTYSGAANVPIVTDTPGVGSGKAADFSSISSYINAGLMTGFGSSIDTGVTIEMWVKSSDLTTVMAPFGNYGGDDYVFACVNQNPDKVSKTGALRILEHTPAGTGTLGTKGDTGFSLDKTTPYVGGDPIEYLVNENTTIVDGDWTYVAFVIESGASYWRDKFRLYIAHADELIELPVSERLTTELGDVRTEGFGDPEAVDFVNAMFLGAFYKSGNPSNPWNGLIDEVAFYTSALPKTVCDAHAAAMVPEPSTIVLLLGMALTLLVYRRK